jgi:hypothetical protein
LMGEATHNSSEFRVIEQAAESFLRRVQPQE